MRPCRWKKLCLGVGRRLLAGCVLISYFAAMVGCPVPVFGNKDPIKVSSCGGHTCCCDLALQEAHACCCYQGVAHEATEPEHVELEEPACPHCAKPALRSQSRVSIVFVSLQAPRCRGAANLWVTTGAVLPPPAPESWIACFIPLGWVSCTNSPGSLLPAIPPDPPPRAVHS
jgi:hypothetical protein